ncbi:MAG: nuclear transport factor 2 family protein [Flavobacteriaceae bacterium]|nr:nuclear transport factor 2 family protein [Flavobacteriaceae bacterium]
MKKISVLIVLSLVFIQSCTNTKEHQNTDENSAKKEINNLLTDWHLGATNADYEAYFSKMDSVSVFIGTDASENWNKKEFETFSKPYFDNGKAWDFKTLERNIYLNNSGDFAWFDELLNTWMGTCRGSGVLEKKSGTWKIKHYVLSVTIPNDDIQKVIKVTREKDSIFLSKFKQ